ncbi:MAG: hypothetical protein FJ207_15240 [Gemmatimonadetes bacterium]|nr:hypothetical protein [Gemmatimonadota bacterium]
MRRLALLLDATVLPVQGPPGTGKTWAGARAIVDLVRAGKRVGICASSHRAIVNLLDAVLDAAADGSVTVRALQKAAPKDASDHAGVVVTDDNAEVVGALERRSVDVVAGTVWLFARAEMADTLDVLVIDEAGQLSLANVVAVGGAARSLMLLGDPNQLAQPSQTSHPDGAGRSALEHALGGGATIPAERGVFLELTRRMHPTLTAFISAAFYDGRLAAHPDCARQQLGGADDLAGAGIRFAPVAHAGNRTTSPEEVERVAELFGRLLEREWTDADGRVRPLQIEDILVVAPYNAHVARLREALPKGARVGTVDRFQGQEAAVVIYSLATSSGEDMPRGIRFLFDPHRMNVALSRARGLAIVVACPALLAVRVRNPADIARVNPLCEIATPAR